MRAPSFMQGVVSRPSVPASFSKPTPPPPAAMVEPAAPPPSPPLAPMAIPAALVELRPPPTPPAPPSPSNDRLVHALEKLLLHNERLAELARSDALEIGFLVAERILEQEISQNPRALMSLVRSAMRKLADSRQVTIALCAVDHEHVKAMAEPGLATVKLEIDPALGPGDCRISSELGVVDGRMSTRLADVKRSIEGEE